MQSIQPGMKLNKDFFLRIYGYEITWPGFADRALEALAAVGCSRAREYYTCIVAEYEAGYEKQRKEVAVWYGKECEKQFEKLEKERGEEIRKQTMKEYLQTLSDSELLKLLQQSRA